MDYLHLSDITKLKEKKALFLMADLVQVYRVQYWALLFPFGGGVGGFFIFYFFYSQCVPNMFSACSLQVSPSCQVVP
jgi:hypothetical protein